MILKGHAFIILLLCCFSIAHTQEKGYVILSSQDTIPCLIKLSANPADFKWTKIGADDWNSVFGVTKLHLDSYNITYQNKEVTGSGQMFLKVLEEGKINLYEYREDNNELFASLILRWYASKNDEKNVKEIRSNTLSNHTNASERRNALYALLAEQPEIAEKLEKNSYNFGTIRDAIHLFNTGQHFDKSTIPKGKHHY